MDVNVSVGGKPCEGPPGLVPEAFPQLMDLCFAHAGQFSLHCGGWPHAQTGALQEALQPSCLGEYRSYAQRWFRGKHVWEKCYLYPAAPETKALLLRHIPNLFERETVTETEEHKAYVEQKYSAYHRAKREAEEKFRVFLERNMHAPDAQIDARYEEIYRGVQKLWLEVFDERDYYSMMDDPCFFRNGQLFFETITHESIGRYWVFSEEFDREIQKIGNCSEVLERIAPPLPRLRREKGLIFYHKSDE